MKTLVLATALVALAAGPALACEFHKSADKTASVLDGKAASQQTAKQTPVPETKSDATKTQLSLEVPSKSGDKAEN